MRRELIWHTSTQPHKIADNLFLVRHQIAADKTEPAKPVEVPTDHIICFNCSGSMSWDLPNVREQVKKKIPEDLPKVREQVKKKIPK